MLLQEFERDDFNLIYDSLWRMMSCAQWEVIHGKNKAIRAAAAETERTINQIVRLMKTAEEQNLHFVNGEIYKGDKKIC